MMGVKSAQRGEQGPQRLRARIVSANWANFARVIVSLNSFRTEKKPPGGSCDLCRTACFVCWLFLPCLGGQRIEQAVQTFRQARGGGLDGKLGL